MGWFWGSSDDASSNANSSQDPLRDLDPSLRDFLKKESPVKYEPSAPTTSQAPEPKPLAPTPQSGEHAEPQVPPQSLYQDGRYAHLWKSYRPLAEVEAEGKTDQQKIMDVLEGYNHRRAEIGRVALENCALEQLEVSDCFRTGGWSAKTTMCRAENRKFERCYMMQAKFLKTLGYLSTLDRPPEVDEKIQMHADTLYHRMLEQEKAIEDAKAEGKPVPSFPPLLSAPKPKLADDDNPHKRRVAEIDDLREKVQKPLKKKLEGLTGLERELEERAIKAEIEAATQAAEQLDVINRQQAEERKKRQEQGRETVTDRLRSLWNGK
ncbi:Uncharacterized protein BP5553_00878 [Venustampulla echinocandica]|uniref:Autophagy protein n=1 Tax=Venustampulla echinocandica TaxID=2656787 RepID=A0A370TZE5_9HELO|nr:Uncharacterized protein BP5553_00878 [Venustampulla echinocandica]RDL40899.1 Uncharacterized protein BP5553_00878 [Venustampulla echinocandica]